MDANATGLLTISTGGVRLQPEGVRRRNRLWRLVQPAPVVAPVPGPGPGLPPPAMPPLPQHVLTYQKADRFLRPLLRQPSSQVWVKWTPLAVYLPLQAASVLVFWAGLK